MTNKKNKYIDALDKGREVVVLGDSEDNSSIFFETKYGGICFFSRDFGIMPYPHTKKDLIEHFKNMEKYGTLYIRGYERKGQD